MLCLERALRWSSSHKYLRYLLRFTEIKNGGVKILKNFVFKDVMLPPVSSKAISKEHDADYREHYFNPIIITHKKKTLSFCAQKKKKPFDPLSFASLPRQVPIFFSQRTAEIELCLKPFPCFSNKNENGDEKKLLSKERNKLSPTGVHRVTQVCSTR